MSSTATQGDYTFPIQKLRESSIFGRVSRLTLRLLELVDEEFDGVVWLVDDQ